MSTLRAVVVDDERLARRTVVELLSTDTDIEVVGQAANGPDAVRLIEDADPDLVFLDVQMPGMNGFQVLERLGRSDPPLVIFVTAHDEHAIRAFDVAAVDYLLKPFDDDRFARAVARAKSTARGSRLRDVQERLVELTRTWGPGAEHRPGGPGPDHGGPGPASRSSDTDAGSARGRAAATGVGVTGDDGYFHRVVVRTAGRIRFVEVDAIDWIESADYCARLHVGERDHLVRASLSLFEARLDPSCFVRVHRSAIVRIDRIRELQRHVRGDYVVVLHDGTTRRLSRARRRAVQAALGVID